MTKLSQTGDSLVYSTLLGGASFDNGRAVALDAAGAAYITGTATDAATDFPTTAGAFDETANGNNDAFVTKLNAAGNAVSYSTFLGARVSTAGLRSPAMPPAPPT